MIVIALPFCLSMFRHFRDCMASGDENNRNHLPLSISVKIDYKQHHENGSSCYGVKPFNTGNSSTKCQTQLANIKATLDQR